MGVSTDIWSLTGPDLWNLWHSKPTFQFYLGIKKGIQMSRQGQNIGRKYRTEPIKIPLGMT